MFSKEDENSVEKSIDFFFLSSSWWWWKIEKPKTSIGKNGRWKEGNWMAVDSGDGADDGGGGGWYQNEKFWW